MDKSGYQAIDPNTPPPFLHVHLISDATGDTVTAVGRAVAAQYRQINIVEHLYTLIRTKEQISQIFEKIKQRPGIVLYTVVNEEISEEIKGCCAKLNLAYIPILDPILTAFEAHLGQPAKRRASAQHVLNEAYYKRIDALDYTLNHDDGQMPKGLEEADVILVGISRTSKTPTSLYLANRGIKTANVPLVLNIPLPEQLLKPKEHQLIVGLIASAEHIAQIRRTREKNMGAAIADYSVKSAILEELNYAKQLCQKNNWPIIDVTRRSIEETAASILSYYQQKKQI